MNGSPAARFYSFSKKIRNVGNLAASLAFAAIFLLSTANIAQAATTPATATNQGPTNIFQCSLFYQPGAIIFESASSVANAIPGQSYEITGKLDNHGLSSVGDATLYALVKKGSATTTSDQAIDYVQLAQDISIPAGDATPVSYSWRIPPTLTDGSYHIQLILVTGNKIPVDVDSPGSLSFSINAHRPPAAVSVKSSKLSSTAKGENLTVVFGNSSNTPKNIPVSATVYIGKELNGKVFQTLNKVLTVPSSGTANESFDIPSYQYPNVTILLQYVSDQGIKNLQIFSFSNPNLPATTISAAGLSKQDQQVAAFACITPSVFKSLTRTEVTLQLIDQNNKVLKETSAEVVSTSTQNLAIKTNLSTQELASFGGQLKVTAILSQNGNQIDQASFNYDCKSDPDSLCPKGGSSLGGIQASFLKNYKMILISLVVLALILYGLSLLGYKKIKGSKNLMILLAASATFIAVPNITHAATWQDTLKSYVYRPSTYSSAFLRYGTGALNESFFDPVYNFYDDCTPGKNAQFPNCLTYSSSWITGPDVVPKGGNDFQDALINLPLWFGVFVIDPVNTNENNISEYNFSIDTNGNYWAAWDLHTVYSYTPGQAWQVPIGTRVGFYVSPYQQSSQYAYNKYFEWFGNPGSFQTYNLGEYVSSLPTQLSNSCDSDTYNNAVMYEDYYLASSNYFTGNNAQSLRPATPSCFYSTVAGRNMSFRLQNPTVAIDGLSPYFSCEPLQADGTMQCVATSLGTTTPSIDVSNISGRFYGVTSYENYRTGSYGCDHSTGGGGCVYTSDGVAEPQDLGHATPVKDQTNPTPTSVTPLGSSSTDPVTSYSQAQATTLSDGQGGVTLPSVALHPFGTISVVPQVFNPGPPVVTTVSQWPGGYGSNWYTGSYSYLFNAVATTSNSDDGVYFQIDTNNDTYYDMQATLSQTYATVTSTPAYSDAVKAKSLAVNETWGQKIKELASAVAVNIVSAQTWQPGYVYLDDTHSIYTLNHQPGYSYTGKGNGYSQFDWDYGGQYTTSGSPLYFNVGFSDPGTSTIQVRSINKFGRTSAWVPVSVSVPVPPPTPNNFQANTGPDCSSGVVLTWDAVSSATGYKIYRLDDGYDPVLIATTSATTTYSDLDTSYPVSKTYELTSYNDNGESYPAYSTAVGAVQCGAVFPPDYVNVVTGNQCGGYEELSWPAGVNAAGYNIYRFNSDTQDWDEIGSTTALTYEDQTAVHTYTSYKVRSYSSANVESADSPGYSPGAYSSHSCNVSNAPTNLVGTADSQCGGIVDFTWDEPATGTPPLGYYLYQGYNNYGSIYFSKVATIPAGTSTYEFTQGNDSPMYYAMSSYNAYDESDYAYSNLVDEGGGYSYEDVVQPSVMCNVTIGDLGCVLNNILINNGDSHTFYSKDIVPIGDSCNNYAETFSCNQGQLYDQNGNPTDGSGYKYAICRLNANILEH